MISEFGREKRFPLAPAESRTEAALAAINSPLLDLSVSGAKGILFAIAGGDDLRMHEIQEAAKIITESVDPDARVIFGAIRDEKLKKNEIKITVIAAGFPEGAEKRNLFSSKTIPQGAPREETREKREINNSFVEQAPKKVEVARENAKAVQDKEPVAIIDLEAEGADDWSAVPAFLRRPKKN